MAARYTDRNGSQPPRRSFKVYDSVLFLVHMQLAESEQVAGLDCKGPGSCIMTSINTGSDTCAPGRLGFTR